VEGTETEKKKRDVLTIERLIAEEGLDADKVAAMTTAQRSAVLPLWRESRRRVEMLATAKSWEDRANRLRGEAAALDRSHEDFVAIVEGLRAQPELKA